MKFRKRPYPGFRVKPTLNRKPNNKINSNIDHIHIILILGVFPVVMSEELSMYTGVSVTKVPEPPIEPPPLPSHLLHPLPHPQP